MTLNPTLRNWLMAVVSVALGAFAMGLPSEAQQPLAGSQGTDTSLPLTDSAVTVAGRGEFADLDGVSAAGFAAGEGEQAGGGGEEYDGRFHTGKGREAGRVI